MTQGRKVLFVGYDLDPATAGRGGVAVYQSSLAQELLAAGWRVTSFMGSRHTLLRRPRLRRSLQDGVKLIELLDSPLRHCDPRADPGSQVRDERVDALTAQVIAEERPSLVHVHDPRLHPASVVDVALAAGVPAIKTLHSAFDVCPQGELMVGGREPCDDDWGGERCRSCLAALPPLSPLKEDLAGSVRGTRLGGVLQRSYRAARDLRQQSAGSPSAPLPLATPGARYAWRKRSFVERLNRYAALHCSSGDMRDRLTAAGVDPGRVRVIPITSRLPELIRPRAEFGDGPLAFGYVTGASPSKGLHVLLDAFDRLPVGRARLIVHGISDPAAWARRHRTPGLSFRPPYDPYRQINDVMAELDVGVVPSVFQEPFGLAGLEFFAARLPVIASRTGGIPEWLEDGVNGVLVAPGDAAALAAAMAALISKPERVVELRAGIRPPKTMRVHAGEMIALYRDVLTGEAGSSPR